MASLRKKPPPDVVMATVDAPAPVAVAINADPPPTSSPEPVAPQDEASAALRRQLDALNQASYSQQQAQVAMQAAQERRAAWVKDNPLAQQHYQALNYLHGEALQSGLADSSPEYFDFFLNNRLVTLQAQQPTTAAHHLIDEMQARAAQERPQEPLPKPAPASINAAHVSAPVSRQVPSAGTGQRSSSKITLTKEHIEFAKVAGITPQEYAQQLMRLREMQANGEYSDRR